VTDRYAVVRLDDLAAYEIPGQAPWHMIRSTLGALASLRDDPGFSAATATTD